MRKYLASLFLLFALPLLLGAQEKSLHQLQQEFVDLRFGMFVHFGLPTFQEADWTDPDLSPEVFNPTRLDTRQWVETAKSAGAKFICVSVKHHAGFCMWNTATTDYSVMHSPLGRDVLKELTDALQEAGMQVMFHFSILDTHHRIRHTLPFTAEKTEFIKAQLKELLTGYGPVNTIMFDGWDAPWGRISYEEVSFPEIYNYVKSLQPNCLVMDLNGSKYPQEALFYSDIRCYEQGAGEKISAQTNRLPAMACYPLQRTWFWKESFPTDKLKDVDAIVRDNIIPYNKAYCTYILNAAPNRDGLIDANAVAAFRRIGKIWKNTGHLVDVPESPAPITEINIAIGRPCDSSWSEDCLLMDLANDDNYSTCWESSPAVKEPWWQVNLDKTTSVSSVVITTGGECQLKGFAVEALCNGEWKNVYKQTNASGRVHICRIPAVEAQSVRLRFISFEGLLSLAEVGVYAEAPTPRKPLIGVSSSRSSSGSTLLATTYTEAVAKAGGVAVVLPTVALREEADDLLTSLDGIIFSGGEDVNPAWYGEDILNETVGIDAVRDHSDSLLARAALASGKPILGICRGEQLMNVMLGGSLYQDIPSQVPQHTGHSGGATNTITLEGESVLSRLYGPGPMEVNSYHHQAVKAPAPGIRITARSDDGVVEAYETPQVWAVQFHPEKLLQQGDSKWLMFFEAFVDKCR